MYLSIFAQRDGVFAPLKLSVHGELLSLGEQLEYVEL